MATFEINGADLRLRLRWLEKLEGAHGDVSVPLSCVAEVRTVESGWGELRGIRAPGTGIPEVVAVGTRRGDFGTDFVAIHGHAPAVVVDLAEAPYGRLVATVDDAEAIAAMIRDAGHR